MKKNKKKNVMSVAPKKSLTRGYTLFLNQIKKDIAQTQLKAATAVTQELTLLYWRIGKGLSGKTHLAAWGANTIGKLAQDLEGYSLGVSGFSQTNLYRMMAFYEVYKDVINFPTAVGKLGNHPILMIPWGHNMALLEKLKAANQRLWYAQKTLENGWSRASLIMWIESDLHKRQGKAITNFKHTLPAPDSDLAEQVLKDPYNFDFLTIDEKAREREIELGLIAHIQKFLLELGQGFAFVGRQYHIKVGSKDFYIDMLFYHLTLRCFIVIELKADEFSTNNVGQMNLYLSAVDDLIRKPNDNPTIGLLLCKSKDNYVAEYALRGVKQPIGVSSYTTKLVESLPKELKGQLPSIKDIEAELKKTNASMSKQPKKTKTKTKKS